MTRFVRKRLSILLLLAAVSTVGIAVAAQSQPQECYLQGDLNADGFVDNEDAILALYVSIFGTEKYPVTQTSLFEGKALDKSDAIYLLYASMPAFQKDYPLGEVHAYFEPIWVWSTDGKAVTVSFKCVCGDDAVFTQDSQELTLLTPQVTQATCEGPGTAVYSAKLSFNGKEYTNSHSVVTGEALAHAWACQSCGGECGDPCEHMMTCGLCGADQAPVGHDWHQQAVEQTAQEICESGEKLGYRCDRCGKQTQETVAGTAGHAWSYSAADDKALDESQPCIYTRHYVCTKCATVASGSEKEGTGENLTYAKHSHKVQSVTDATCQAKGKIVYGCTVAGCGDTYAEETPVNPEAHAWDGGTTDAATGVTTFLCTRQGCQGKKTAISMAAGAGANAEALAHAEEIQVDIGGSSNAAAVTMDESTKEQVVSGLGGDNLNLMIQVEETPEVVGSLTEEEQAKIGNNPVYDFNMFYADENGNRQGDNIRNFEGKITVSLPYTLQEGDDPNLIHVWYIDLDTQVEAERLKFYEGVYNAGFVTFQTDHFSYYTVVRMTPAERCEKLLGGHTQGAVLHKDASCTEGGYEKIYCKRCMTVYVDTETAPLNHKLVRSQEPSCTAAGKITCQNGCGYAQTLKELGHDMQVSSDKSKAATCSAAGVEVLSCIRSGCGHETKKVLPQLTHSYTKTDSVAATCTEAGFDRYTCDRCGDTQQRNQQAPLGHNYQKSGWTWAKDHSTATLALKCSRCSGEKSVTATVKETANGNPCLGGAEIYKAEVVYNKISYSDTQSVATEAVGHKADQTWHRSDDGKQHYHLCGVCKEPVEAAAHGWNEGVVTTPATCQDSGIRTYTCGVCGETKAETVAATGFHEYVDGKCVLCGEGADCDHEMTRQIPIDCEKLGFCKGTELFVTQCACGKQKTVDGSFGCEAGTEETDNGYSMVCPNCPMSIEIGWIDAKVTDMPCAVVSSTTMKLYADKALVADCLYCSEPQEHYLEAHTTQKEVDLKDYGLCGEKLEQVFCNCGQVSRTSWNGESDCNWLDEVRQDYENGYTVTVTCMTCGAQKVQTCTYGQEYIDIICRRDTTYRTSYLVDGKEVFSFENHGYDQACEETLSYKLLGTTCEDGLLIKYSCAKCGNSWENTTDYHQTLLRTEYDLSGYGICAVKAVQMTCPCPQKHQSYTVEYPNGSCEEIYYHDRETGELLYSQCRSCKAIYNRSESHSEKDEDCVCIRYGTMTLKLEDGTVIFTGSEKYDSHDHNIIHETVTLMPGAQDCDGGVTVQETCGDCGRVNTWEIWGHHSVHTFTDLSGYGLPNARIVENRCACGHYGDIRVEGDYEQVGGSENAFLYLFRDTELSFEISWSETAIDGVCQVKRTTTVTLYDAQGNAVLEKTVTGMEVRHDEERTYTLVLPEMGCCGGVQVDMRCRTCGYGDSYTEMVPEDAHYHKDSERTLAFETACGPVYQETYSCVCGQETGSYLDRSENRCSFEHGGYEDGVTYFVCSACQTKRTMVTTTEKVEGETCKVIHHLEATYLQGDTVLYTVRESNEGESHDWLAQSFELFGTACQEGYKVHMLCRKCGQADTQEYPMATCDNMWETEIQTVSHSACGEIAIVARSCACGSRGEQYLRGNCQFEHWSTDPDGTEHYLCDNCKTGYALQITRGQPDGQCNVTVRRVYTFTLSGSTLDPITVTGQEKEHDYLYSYDIPSGAVCADGFTEHRSCTRCGAADSYTYEAGYFTDHYVGGAVVRYDLADYGISCGGYIEGWGCACGAQQRENYYMDCGIESWTVDTATGMQTGKCQDCGVVWYMGESGTMDGCLFTGHALFRAEKNGQELLNVSVPISAKRHTHVFDSATFTNGTDCLDGGEALLVCACGDSYIERWSAGEHRHFLRQRIDLALTGDGCEGILEQWLCACGESGSSYMHTPCLDGQDITTQQRPDGVEVNTQSCKTCGLSTQWYTTSVKTGCQVEWTEYRSYYRADGSLIMELRPISHNGEDHNYEQISATLKEGSVTCEDGIVILARCADCGKENSHEAEHHAVFLKDTYDLKQAGAGCDSVLSHFGCACGLASEERYELTYREGSCAFNYDGIAVWAADKLTTDYRTTMEATMGIEQIAQKVTCPHCDLQIRYEDYWAQEGCKAIRYLTWQYFDAATGTWTDIPGYSNIVRETSWNHIMDHDDSRQNVDPSVSGCQQPDCHRHNTDIDTCLTCGTTFVKDWCWTANDQLTHIIEVRTNNNSQPNDEWQSVTIVEEREDIYGGIYATTSTLWNVILADGSQGSISETSVYHPQSCTKDFTRVELNGHTWGDEGLEYHIQTRTDTVDVKPTCSQFGKQGEECVCTVCGGLQWSNVEKIEPTQHTWDSGKCSGCGMDEASKNGSIVLEDMTAKFDGTNTVIGYWNQIGQDFTCDVSLAYGGTSTAVEVEPKFWTMENQGVCAVALNNADLQAAIDTILDAAGYTGSYTWSINFYQVDWNYAVSFDATKQ